MDKNQENIVKDNKNKFLCNICVNSRHNVASNYYTLFPTDSLVSRLLPHGNMDQKIS